MDAWRNGEVRWIPSQKGGQTCPRGSASDNPIPGRNTPSDVYKLHLRPLFNKLPQELALYLTYGISIAEVFKKKSKDVIFQTRGQFFAELGQGTRDTHWSLPRPKRYVSSRTTAFSAPKTAASPLGERQGTPKTNHAFIPTPIQYVDRDAVV